MSTRSRMTRPRHVRFSLHLDTVIKVENQNPESSFSPSTCFVPKHTRSLYTGLALNSECLYWEMPCGSIWRGKKKSKIIGMEREHEIKCDMRFASCEVNTRHIFSRVKRHSWPLPFFLHPFSLLSLLFGAWPGQPS